MAMKQVEVHIEDGPAMGKSHYYFPLPKTLVIPTDHVWHDYIRVGYPPSFGKQASGQIPRYAHSPDCPCFRPRDLVDMDLAVLAW